MRVLVTGSRQLLDQSLIYAKLDEQYAVYQTAGEADLAAPFTVVHGGAPGADTLAAQWCHDRRDWPGIVQEVHPADWRRGRFAGHQRNHEMVRLGADIVLAFFQPGAGNAGTRNCVENTDRWLPGVEVREVWADA